MNPGDYCVVLGVKRDGEWKRWTFTQYQREVRMAAKALIMVLLTLTHDAPIATEVVWERSD